MNYRRWIIVGFVAALAVFSFWHLSTAGLDYKVLTTSDSGYFYGIARDMNRKDGLIEEYSLEDPPRGASIPKGNQFQPLMLVTLYRGLDAVDPSISLMGVSQYFSPFLFSLAVIGAFLAARELGGDLAGCASALFTSTLVGSIYWTKIGAFDREITLIFFGTWLFYLLAKVFRARGREMFKYSALTGLFYGMFLLTWPGAPFLGVIIGLALILIILERAVSGLGLTLVGIVLFVVGHAFDPFDVPELIGVFVFLAGLARMGLDWEALKNIEGNIVSSIRSNLWLIGGILGAAGIATLMAIPLGGYAPNFWINLFTDRIPGFLGVGGGGGVSFPRIATEVAPVPPEPGRYLNNLIPKLYGSELLTGVTIFLVAIGLMKAFWSSEKRELFALSWLVIIAPMPLAQARFFRLFWFMWPILAGFGFGALVWMIRKVVMSPSFSASDWMGKLRHPMVLALVAVLFIVPFIQNVRADTHTSDTRPWPHGGSLPRDYYHSLLDSFNWIENEKNTENSVIVIPWSYGHFATGATGRPTVTDGAQSSGRRGKWKDSPGLKPPDYIKYEEGGKGYIIGKNASARSYQINGRRIDVRRLIGMGDENEFAFLVKLYRENYKLKMDYVLFNDSFNTRLNKFTKELTILGLSKNMETAKPRYGEGMYFFSFKEENVEFNYQGAPSTQENETLAGVIYYDLQRGRLLNYSFTPSPEKSKILWIFFGKEGKIQRGGLADFGGVPMLIRALDGREMPDYLKEVYRSPYGHAAVYRIVHENVSKYL